MTSVAQTATLAHGYTMAEIDDMAHRAAHIRRSSLVDYEEAFASAWHGVVEALYSADSQPDRRDLVNAGTRAVATERKRVVSLHGINVNGTGEHKTDGSRAPRFQAYWGHRNFGDGDFTDQVTERLALPTVLAVLSAKQYEVISTLAAFDGDIEAAASALGMKRNAFNKTLRRGRLNILAVWYEHETPKVQKKPVGNVDECANGHDRSQHGYRNDKGKWICRECQRRGAARHCRNYRERKRVAALGETA